MKNLKENLFLLGGMAALLWGIEILDTLSFFVSLDQFGIRPRSGSGLVGVVTAPWLHAGFGHLVSNTLPFLAFGGIILASGRKYFVAVTLFTAIAGGGALWLLGPPGTNHIGASLVIFGYLGFLLSRGFFERSAFWVVVSLVLAVAYGGVLFGVLPGQSGISWQGHLCGFLAGILSAKLFCRPRERVPVAEGAEEWVVVGDREAMVGEAEEEERGIRL